jgi:hypothetical protein
LEIIMPFLIWLSQVIQLFYKVTWCSSCCVIILII